MAMRSRAWAHRSNASPAAADGLVGIKGQAAQRAARVARRLAAESAAKDVLGLAGTCRQRDATFVACMQGFDLVTAPFEEADLAPACRHTIALFECDYAWEGSE